jgi:hypothetical protein
MRRRHAIFVILLHVVVSKMAARDSSAVALPASPAPIDYDPWNIPYRRTRVTHLPLDARQFQSLLDGRNIGTGRLSLGDQIELRAGTVYAGAFRVPNLTEGRALKLLGKSNIDASDLTITHNTFDMRNVRPNFWVLQGRLHDNRRALCQLGWRTSWCGHGGTATKNFGRPIRKLELVQRALKSPLSSK